MVIFHSYVSLPEGKWRYIHIPPIRGHFHGGTWWEIWSHFRVPDFQTQFRHGSCHSNMNLLFRDPISGLGKIYTPTTKMGSSPLFEWKSPGVSTVTSDLIVRRRVSAQCWLVDEDCIFGTVPGRKRQGATCHGQKWREIIISLIMWTLD